MPLSDTDTGAVSAWCEPCGAAFYVTAAPRRCPYCGGRDVAPGYPVAIRPE